MVKLVECAALPSLVPIRPRNEVAVFHACTATLILALEDLKSWRWETYLVHSSDAESFLQVQIMTSSLLQRRSCNTAIPMTSSCILASHHLHGILGSTYTELMVACVQKKDKCRNMEGIQHSGLVLKPLAHILSLGFGKEGLGLGLHGATMIFLGVALRVFLGTKF